MGYENDPYRDEDGEPLMDFDEDMPSDGDEPQQYLLDDEADTVHDRRERSTTPVYSDSKANPRKRLIKKYSSDKVSRPVDFGLEDEEVGGDYSGGDEDNRAGVMKESHMGGGKRKEGGEKRKSVEKKRKGEAEARNFKVKRNGGGRVRDEEADPEMKEMWDTIAGGDSEEDQDGVRTLDDDNFIDDSGVDPAHRYLSDNEHSPSRAPQAEEGEEDAEINDLFKIGKKRKKTEKSPAEVALLVENVMAELEVVAEEDAELNRQGKPAINKLKKLSLLTDVLSKKQLQQEFLDHGVLTLMKNWLEPLPDGSLPNINIRAAVLRILFDFPIDLEQFDRREQLKKSGLGKVIMFLSKSDEETTANRKLAKELVDKWSRPIFNKSTRFEDMKNFEDERVLRQPSVKKVKGSGMPSGDYDLDLSKKSTGGSKSGHSSSSQHASRPEAMSMDFLVRPQSKVDPDEVRARAKQVVQDQRRVKMNKKLQQLKGPKRKQLQATKLSVEGRGMVKYL
ncbi:protein IWS1 homolog 1-like [Salvia miltiorrhiza]|uniref:protein IWS1 homolog 1-like n=1 Tax=Salvia miltiorrhiza TaxID=226208 RepID=UPI0025AC7AC8|nr:protein IWS1 homolog 1-like [Salvia miltiorrhiza]